MITFRTFLNSHSAIEGISEPMVPPRKRGRKSTKVKEPNSNDLSTMPQGEIMQEEDAAPKALQDFETIEEVSYSEEEAYENENIAASEDDRALGQNQINIQLSWTLMSQMRQMARFEGISVEDLVVELVTEGLVKRVFEDKNRPAPSHLMTRTGYIPPEAGHLNQQPQLSHHANNNYQQRNQQGNQNNRWFGQQQRNNTFNNPQNNRPGNRNTFGQNNQRPQNGINNFRNNYNNNQQQQRFPRPQYNNQQQQRFNNAGGQPPPPSSSGFNNSDETGHGNEVAARNKKKS